MADFWGAMFGGRPSSILDSFDAYNNSAKNLAAARNAKIIAALNQIKLQYAPQNAQSEASKNAAEASSAQNTAKYAPQMSLADLAQKHAETIRAYAATKGEELDNVIKKAKANHADESVLNDLQIQRAKIGLLHAQASQASSKAQALVSGTGGKNTAPYLDPKTRLPVSNPYMQQNNPGMSAPSQPLNAPMPSQNSIGAPDASAPIPMPQTSAPQNAPVTSGAPDDSSDTGMPSAPSPQAAAAMPQAVSGPQQAASPPKQSAQSSEITFPGADPSAPNVLAPVGPPDSRGHAGAYMNPHTGEHFTVLSTTGREKVRNQLVALRQAEPYIDDLIKYGSVGKIGPSGANELLPNALGGVPRGVGANYDKSLAAASEHIMVGSQMQKTDKTTEMIHTILNRQNFESRKDYTKRMRVFQQHLKALDQDTKETLDANMMSVDRSALVQNYIEDQYNKLTSDTVDVIRPDGTEGTIPKENLQKALSRGYKRAS